jgi:hypothetical protein
LLWRDGRTGGKISAPAWGVGGAGALVLHGDATVKWSAFV